MLDATRIDVIQLLGVPVAVVRADLNHPIIQGNKLWKLKHNLTQAQQQNATGVLTFGGAYSNHLLATAYACHALGLKAVGVVRGDELNDNPVVWSETLHRCQQYGMQLCFIDRAEYRQKQHGKTTATYLERHPNAVVIPEGGSNELAVQGVAEWLMDLADTVDQTPSQIICPVGTGGTLAGLVVGAGQLNWSCEVLGVLVLRGVGSIETNIKQWMGQHKPLVDWRLLSQFHGGGYAKHSTEMQRFAVTFSQQNNIPLDKIYNIKSFYALAQLIKTGEISPSDRPMIIHTGGLQGGVVGSSVL